MGRDGWTQQRHPIRSRKPNELCCREWSSKLCYCLSFWDTDFNSIETHYKVKGTCFHCSIKRYKSHLNSFQKLFFPCLCWRPPLCCESDVARFASRTPSAVWLGPKRGTRWHFQHKHIITSSALPVHSLLAQPVSQGAGTELWCQSGFSCAALQGHDPHNQMEPALHTHTHTHIHTHTHTHVNHVMCNFTKHTNKDHSFVSFQICQPNIDFCTAFANSLCPFCQM